MDYKILGEKIRSQRTKLKLTQAELAELVNLTTAYIGQIERAERKFSIETLVSIAEVLKVSVDALLLDNFKQNNKPIINEMLLLLENRSNKEINFAVNIVRSAFESLDDL